MGVGVANQPDGTGEDTGEAIGECFGEDTDGAIGVWRTGFMLLQGNRLESLCNLMTTWMKRHPLRPLENEVILVQSNGIGQWLKLALAADPRDGLGGGCGIAAALDVTLPARFIWRVYQSLLGDLPETSAFDKAPMSWRLYRLLGDLDALPQGLPDPHCFAPLRRFLAADTDARRRFQLAERLADLYDQYQVYRADWLDAWRSGDDCLIRPDGTRHLVPDEQRWQPTLWRLLNQDIVPLTGHLASPQDVGAKGEVSRADIHRQFLTRAKALSPEQRPRELPRRVVVFGISSLPRQALEVLDAIAHLSQVMLFVHNPSQHYWGDIIEGRELFRRTYARNPGRKVPENLDETQLHLHGHPLLAAWGKQGRDYIRLLDEHDQRQRYEAEFQAENLDIDLFESPGSDSLLQQLQDDILELRPLPERQALATVVDPEHDRSLGFLIAHSRQREIEILHDQLLDAFEQAAAGGEPLHPRDLLVMVPDIDLYAPHIDAVFGRLAPDDPRQIPFHLSDQGQRHRNPLLIGLEALLQLPRSRFAVSELLDLLDIPALRARFGIDESDLPRLRLWISGANIRWGLDARQRAGLGLPDGLEQNSWAFGLRRMLLGFAAGAGGPWQGIEPYDEIGGLEAALIGPLVQLLETMERYWQALREPRNAQRWTQLIAQLLQDAFSPVSEADNLAITLVQQTLEQWLQDCQRGNAADEDLALEIVRESLLAALDEPTLSQRFLAGAVNFATLMPMRAIPFRQIWLLGMNDGDYPRSRHPEDFDLMVKDYRPGDRSRREDDRYLFLEALLSARERLVISWVGRSIRDNSVRPPSVLVGQLRDHINAGWKLSDAGTRTRSDRTLVAALTTEHPLQPFSRRYFEPSRDPRLFTYAGEWRAIHDGEPEIRKPEDRPDNELIAWQPDGPINLDHLTRFLRSPVDAFYHQRLRISAPGDLSVVEDVETFEMDALGAWQFKSALINEVFEPGLSEADFRQGLQQGINRAQSQGLLLEGSFGDLMGESLTESLPDLYRQWCAALACWPLPLEQPQAIEVIVAQDAGALMVKDVLTALRQGETGVGQVILQPSSLIKNNKYQWRNAIRPWLQHLAAQSAEQSVTTQVLSPAGTLRFSPVAEDQARPMLEDMITAWWLGMRSPLPVALNSAIAWLEHGGPRQVVDIAELSDTSIADAASTAFEKDLEYSVYLSRQYDCFESLWSGGAFADWAFRLYAHLYASIKQPKTTGQGGKGR